MVLCVDSIESVGWFENNRREDWKVKELVGCLLVMFVLRIMFWGEERGREILSIPRRVKSSIYRKKKKKEKGKKAKGNKRNRHNASNTDGEDEEQQLRKKKDQRD